MKITIAGYYGFGNVGDELILTSMTTSLNAEFPGCEILVLSHNPKKTWQDHGLRAIFRWNLFAVAMAFLRSDLFILGGGGLIQDQTSVFSFLYYAVLVVMARACRCPVRLSAIGVESIQHAVSRWVLVFVFRFLDLTISVRDHESQDILRHIVPANTAVTIVRDPVFSLNFKKPHLLSRKSVLFIPRYPCSAHGKQLLERLAHLLHEKHGFLVSVAVFHEECDSHFFSMKPDAGILTYKNKAPITSAPQMAEYVMQFPYVISARFHGLVLASMAGNSFLGVGSPEKVGRFCVEQQKPYLPWTADEHRINSSVQILLQS